jgi:hypothetical protein
MGEEIAAGTQQQLVEESLLAWARLMRTRYGRERLALGAGVFMNVKAHAGGRAGHAVDAADLVGDQATDGVTPTTASSWAHLLLSRSLRSTSSPSVTSSKAWSIRG